MRLTYLAYVFGKLNDLNVSLQGTGGTHIFSVHDKIRGFKRKLQLWKQYIETENFDCFETLATFLTTNELSVPGGIRTEMVNHLQELYKNLEIHFKDSMEKCASKTRVATPFLPADWNILELQERTINEKEEDLNQREQEMKARELCEKRNDDEDLREKQNNESTNKHNDGKGTIHHKHHTG
jgi:hypothetical protein